jgi:hypothetical protein
MNMSIEPVMLNRNNNIDIRGHLVDTAPEESKPFCANSFSTAVTHSATARVPQARAEMVLG